MGHKYIAKVKTGSGTRYFYTAEEYAAYKHDAQKYGDRGNAAKSYTVRKGGTKSNSVNRPNTRHFATKKAVHPGNDRGNAARNSLRNSPKAVVRTKANDVNITKGFKKVVRAGEKQKNLRLSSRKTMIKKGWDYLSKSLGRLGNIAATKINSDKARAVTKKLNSWIKKAEKKYDNFKNAPLVSHETTYKSKVIKDEINGKPVKTNNKKKAKTDKDGFTTTTERTKKKGSLITHETTYGSKTLKDEVNGKTVYKNPTSSPSTKKKSTSKPAAKKTSSGVDKNGFTTTTERTKKKGSLFTHETTYGSKTLEVKDNGKTTYKNPSYKVNTKKKSTTNTTPKKKTTKKSSKPTFKLRRTGNM